MAILEYLNIGGREYSVFHAPLPIDGIKTVWNNQTHSSINADSSAWDVCFTNCVPTLLGDAGFSSAMVFISPILHPKSGITFGSSVSVENMPWSVLLASDASNNYANYAMGFALSPYGYGVFYRNTHANYERITQSSGRWNQIYCNFSFSLRKRWRKY